MCLIRVNITVICKTMSTSSACSSDWGLGLVIAFLCFLLFLFVRPVFGVSIYFLAFFGKFEKPGSSVGELWKEIAMEGAPSTSASLLNLMRILTFPHNFLVYVGRGGIFNWVPAFSLCINLLRSKQVNRNVCIYLVIFFTKQLQAVIARTTTIKCFAEIHHPFICIIYFWRN